MVRWLAAHNAILRARIRGAGPGAEARRLGDRRLLTGWRLFTGWVRRLFRRRSKTGTGPSLAPWRLGIGAFGRKDLRHVGERRLDPLSYMDGRGYRDMPVRTSSIIKPNEALIIYGELYVGVKPVRRGPFRRRRQRRQDRKALARLAAKLNFKG